MQAFIYFLALMFAGVFGGYVGARLAIREYIQRVGRALSDVEAAVGARTMATYKHEHRTKCGHQHCHIVATRGVEQWTCGEYVE